MNTSKTRVLSLLLALVMIVGIVPFQALAAVDYDETLDDYYKVISKTDYELAPGITESEIVLNNDAGSHRQVAHVVEVDIDNPYTKVMPSYKGMAEGLNSKNYGVQVMSQQAAYAEANGYGNVVAAMNLSLSWYNSDYYAQNPTLVGEPLGYLVMDGVMYTNSQGKTAGAQTCLVINFDEKDGAARPADIPKTEIRSTSTAITGWEEQVIPANFGFLVKDGKNQFSKDHTSDAASRSFVGIKENGDIVIVMNDGRQEPYSSGFNSYEMAQFMLSLGCVQAVNGDGGGSSTFLSQRPGEDLKLNCSPSDGAERATTHGVLVISTAPATGEFVRAQITTDDKYYTPGTAVQFHAIGTDLVGTEAEIPADAQWVLSDDSMGTIDQTGLFTSNGTVGEVTAQLLYNGEVTGEATINIVIPEISFKQQTMVLPYGETVELDLNVTTNEGRNTVSTKPGDIVFTLSDAAMGTIDGNIFTTTSDATVTGGTITAVICGDTEHAITASIKFGKASDILYDFENNYELIIDNSLTGGDEDSDTTKEYYYGWHIGDIRVDQFYGYKWTGKKSYPTTIGVQMGKDMYLVDKLTGKVRNGETALAVNIDWTSVTSMGSKQMNIWFPEPIDVSEATSMGMWLYIPDVDTVKNTLTFRWCGYTKDGSIANLNTAFSSIVDADCGFTDEGWYYVSVDALANNLSTIEYFQIYANDASAAYINPMAEYTFYIDDVTVDFSDAAIDRANPYFSSVTISNGDTDVALTNGYVSDSNIVTLFAQATENTSNTNYTGLNPAAAKVTVDGQEITSGVSINAGGKISVVDLPLSDGIHTIKFYIYDNQGNMGSITRKVVVCSGKGDVHFELDAANAAKPAAGSVIYLNLVAEDLSTVDSVVTTVRLDGCNDWDLAGIEVAGGFEASYTVNANNEAEITITRVFDEVAEDTNILAKLPVRIWMTSTYLNPEYIALGYVKDDPALQDKYYALTPYAMWLSDGVSIIHVVMDASEGIVTYTDGTVDTFSSEEYNLETELNRYRNTKNEGDANFYQDKASFHIHTPGEATDKAATCTESGYTGRIFCVGCSCDTVKRYEHECDTHEGCGSAIEWGTVIPATGHDYQVVGGVLKCVNSCGKLFNGEKDGKTYIDGMIANGWIDNTYYYIDGVMVTGQYYLDGTLYTFGEDGVYNPAYQYTGFYETADGKLMYFMSNKPVTGHQYLSGESYFFDADGFGYEGAYIMAGETCVFENGQYVTSTTANVLNAGKAGPSVDYVLYADGTFVLDGTGATYSFNNHGTRPFIDYAYKIKTLKIGEGVTRIGSYFMCYSSVSAIEFAENSSLQQIGTAAFLNCFGLREVTLADSVTYVSDMAFGRCENLQKVVFPVNTATIHKNAFKEWKNLTLYVIDGSYAMEYAVANNIPHVTYQREIKREIIEENGVLYYYEDGVKTYGGLIHLDGNYYYVRSNYQLVVDRTYWVTKTNDLLPEGNYTFDAEGKMVNPPEDKPDTPDVPDEPTNEGSIVDVNGTLYYYKDGKPYYAGLIQIDGDYYYVRSSGQLVVNRTYWVTKTNDLLPAADYTFGADGKMITEGGDSGDSGETDTGSIVDVGGTLYYYKDGKPYYAGLIQIDGDYYYVRSNGQLVVNRTYWITKTNDLLPAANYTFGADGKMIIE